jgi:hypothetical protein
VLREQAEADFGRMFIGLFGRQWRPAGQFPPFITIAPVCFVRTGWDGTKKGSTGCFATSMVEKAKPA